MPRVLRRFLVDPTEVGIYHCVNRCVRRSFLCGKDPVSGKDYEHRRQWMQDRIQFLAGQSGIDVLGFSVIPSDLAPILERLRISNEGWLQLASQFGRVFRRAAGRPQSLQRERDQRGGRLMQGIAHSRTMFC